MGKFREEVKRFIPVADAIAGMFGRCCEVTLHDLSTPDSSVVYTRNNHVTGSYIGQPVPHLLTQVLLSPKLKNDVAANYRTEVQEEKFVKSTTVLLRNAAGEAIGALSIHMDMEPFSGIHRFLLDFISVEQQHDGRHNPKTEEPLRSEPELDSITDIVDRMIARIIPEQEDSEIDKNTKMQWVRLLDQKGVFLIKGALEKVAAKLDISKVTLYSYLDEIRGPKESG